jgi:hypothetical protein
MFFNPLNRNEPSNARWYLNMSNPRWFYPPWRKYWGIVNISQTMCGICVKSLSAMRPTHCLTPGHFIHQWSRRKWFLLKLVLYWGFGHRIKISNRRAAQRCNVSSFFYAKICSLLARRRSSQPVQRAYWPENVIDWLGKWRPTCVMRHARGQKLQSFRRKWPCYKPAIWIFIICFGGAIVRASAFHLWDRGFDSCYELMWKESVNALPKVVGFLQALRFPPTGRGAKNRRAREHCSQEMLNGCRKFLWMKICYWKFEGNLNTHVPPWVQQHMVYRHYSLNLKP